VCSLLVYSLDWIWAMNGSAGSGVAARHVLCEGCWRGVMAGCFGL
jgi:hypothetical protein